MSKKSNNQFTVTKRFTVWLEKQITAESLEAAVKRAQEMQFADFAELDSGALLLDAEQERGTGVREEW